MIQFGTFWPYGDTAFIVSLSEILTLFPPSSEVDMVTLAESTFVGLSKVWEFSTLSTENIAAIPIPIATTIATPTNFLSNVT